LYVKAHIGNKSFSKVDKSVSFPEFLESFTVYSKAYMAKFYASILISILQKSEAVFWSALKTSQKLTLSFNANGKIIQYCSVTQNDIRSAIKNCNVEPTLKLYYSMNASTQSIDDQNLLVLTKFYVDRKKSAGKFLSENHEDLLKYVEKYSFEIFLRLLLATHYVHGCSQRRPVLICDVLKSVDKIQEYIEVSICIFVYFLSEEQTEDKIPWDISRFRERVQASFKDDFKCCRVGHWFIESGIFSPREVRNHKSKGNPHMLT
jgi:hypothetical protein